MSLFTKLVKFLSKVSHSFCFSSKIRGFRSGLMYKNECRFRDAIMPDVVTDGTKRYEVPEKWKPANIVR